MWETDRFKVGDKVLYKNQLCTIKMRGFYYSMPVYFIEFNDKSIIVSFETDLEEYKPKTSLNSILKGVDYVKWIKDLSYSMDINGLNKPKTNKNMENKEFTIDDLKSGMIVEYRNGEKYLVVTGCEFSLYPSGIALLNKDSFMTLNDTSYNLLSEDGNSSWDIIKIYYDGYINRNTYSIESQKLIWKRKEKQQFTKQQIAEKLGLSIDEFEIK